MNWRRGTKNNKKQAKSQREWEIVGPERGGESEREWEKVRERMRECKRER